MLNVSNFNLSVLSKAMGLSIFYPPWYRLSNAVK